MDWWTFLYAVAKIIKSAMEIIIGLATISFGVSEVRQMIAEYYA